MDVHDQVPVLILHVLEADISQDTGIVQQDIDSAKVLDGSLDDLVAIGDTVVVCDGFTARGLDFLNDNICSLRGVSKVMSR